MSQATREGHLDDRNGFRRQISASLESPKAPFCTPRNLRRSRDGSSTFLSGSRDEDIVLRVTGVRRLAVIGIVSRGTTYVQPGNSHCMRAEALLAH